MMHYANDYTSMLYGLEQMAIAAYQSVLAIGEPDGASSYVLTLPLFALLFLLPHSDHEHSPQSRSFYDDVEPDPP